MKKQTIWVLCLLMVVSVGSVKVQAEEKSNIGLLLTAGGGLGLVLPAVDIDFEGYINRFKGLQKVNTFAAFGFNVLANATLTYKFDNNWAIGGSVNIGYNLMGGPQASYDMFKGKASYHYRYGGFGKMDHSFIADLNFCARSPSKKGGDLIMEAGVTLFPTWYFLVFREDGVVKVGEDVRSTNQFTFDEITDYYYYSGHEATMMAGPNIFVGIDYYVTEYFDLIFGVRLRAAFGCANMYYLDQRMFDQAYTNSIIQLAFEFKFNYYHEF